MGFRVAERGDLDGSGTVTFGGNGFEAAWGGAVNGGVVKGDTDCSRVGATLLAWAGAF